MFDIISLLAAELEEPKIGISGKGFKVVCTFESLRPRDLVREFSPSILAAQRSRARILTIYPFGPEISCENSHHLSFRPRDLVREFSPSILAAQKARARILIIYPCGPEISCENSHHLSLRPRDLVREFSPSILAAQRSRARILTIYHCALNENESFPIITLIYTTTVYLVPYLQTILCLFTHDFFERLI